jgi:hypothetical protein
MLRHRHAVTAATATGRSPPWRGLVSAEFPSADWSALAPTHSPLKSMGVSARPPTASSKQAKRKNNTHPHILLSTMTVHSIINARRAPAPTSVAKSAVTKRKADAKDVAAGATSAIAA